MIFERMRKKMSTPDTALSWRWGWGWKRENHRLSQNYRHLHWCLLDRFHRTKSFLSSWIWNPVLASSKFHMPLSFVPSLASRPLVSTPRYNVTTSTYSLLPFDTGFTSITSFLFTFRFLHSTCVTSAFSLQFLVIALTYNLPGIARPGLWVSLFVDFVDLCSSRVWPKCSLVAYLLLGPPNWWRTFRLLITRFWRVTFSLSFSFALQLPISLYSWSFTWFDRSSSWWLARESKSCVWWEIDFIDVFFSFTLRKLLSKSSLVVYFLF